MLTGCAEAEKETAMNDCADGAALFNTTMGATGYYVHLCMETKGYDFVVRPRSNFDFLDSNSYQAHN
jgi:hypothetical protein